MKSELLNRWTNGAYLGLENSSKMIKSGQNSSNAWIDGAYFGLMGRTLDYLGDDKIMSEILGPMNVKI